MSKRNPLDWRTIRHSELEETTNNKLRELRREVKSDNIHRNNVFEDIQEILNKVKESKQNVSARMYKDIDLRKATTYEFVKESQNLLIELRKEVGATQATGSVYNDLENVLSAVKSLKEKLNDVKKIVQDV
jgi:uncharacterized coiled-coil DUF342 family protein